MAKKTKSQKPSAKRDSVKVVGKASPAREFSEPERAFLMAPDRFGNTKQDCECGTSYELADMLVTKYTYTSEDRYYETRCPNPSCNKPYFTKWMFTDSTFLHKPSWCGECASFEKTGNDTGICHDRKDRMNPIRYPRGQQNFINVYCPNAKRAPDTTRPPQTEPPMIYGLPEGADPSVRANWERILNYACDACRHTYPSTACPLCRENPFPWLRGTVNAWFRRRVARKYPAPCPYCKSTNGWEQLDGIKDEDGGVRQFSQRCLHCNQVLDFDLRSKKCDDEPDDQWGASPGEPEFPPGYDHRGIVVENTLPKRRHVKPASMMARHTVQKTLL